MIKSLFAATLCAGALLNADIPASGPPPAADSLLRVAPKLPPVLPYGLLWLEVDPADAEVSLDGNFLDEDVWLISMAPGRHDLSIRKDGFHPIEKAIGIGAGENLKLAVRLEKAP